MSPAFLDSGDESGELEPHLQSSFGMSKLETLKEWMLHVLFSVGLSRTSNWDLDRKKETGDLRQRAGQRLALRMEGGGCPPNWRKLVCLES